MKKIINQLSTLCEQNNIYLPQRVNKFDARKPTKYDDRFHALKASLTQLKDYLIDFGASNHMVASRESFITFTLSGGPSSHMGDDSKILAIEKGSDKI